VRLRDLRQTEMLVRQHMNPVFEKALTAAPFFLAARRQGSAEPRH
jgi:hypothetical protein